MMTTSQEKGIANHLIKYGPLYVFVAGLVMNWAFTTARIDQIDYRVTKVEAKEENANEILGQMKVDIAVIKDNVAEIKRKVQ